jgi:diguanylate cyclase (GGDEF)-like protein/PAS domain S-box-containing protein
MRDSLSRLYQLHESPIFLTLSRVASNFSFLRAVFHVQYLYILNDYGSIEYLKIHSSMNSPQSAQSKKFKPRSPLRLVLLYAMFAVLWITTSDYLLFHLFRDPTLLAQVRLAKGLLFAVATSGLLYLLLRRWYIALLNALAHSNQAFEELKQKGQELAHVQELNQQLLDNSPVLIYILDTEGRFVLVNKRFIEFFEVGHDQLIGQNRTVIFSQEVAEQEKNSDLEIIRTKRAMSIEQRQIGPNGLRFYLSERFPLLDEAGIVIGICVISRDISERKKAQEALEASLEFSNNLVSTMQDGFSVLDKNGRALDANLALCRMTGFSREELVGLNAPFPYWPPEEYENIQAAFQKTLKGEVNSFELTFMRRSGERFPVIVSPAVVKDRDDRIISYTATIKDITERKHTERLLVESRAKYKHLVESLPVIIYEFSDKRGGLYYSPQVATILGYALEHLYANPLLWNQSIHPDDSQILEQALKEFKANGNFNITYRIRDAHGNWRWFNDRSIDRREENGELIIIGLTEDITDHKAAEEKIQHLAFYDSLSSLPNRRLLMDRLKQALVSSARIGRAGALLFIDLDNFKNLNDTLGHDIGDLLLQQVAQRLDSSIREGDTVARLGGDEFVVMLLDLSEQPFEAAAQTETIGEKILAALSQPYQLEKNTYRCTASIGVTLFYDNQQAADELMKQADIAMYQAKKAGRNALRFFDRQMQENISARVSLEGELQNALEFQQFHLYYQIQVDSSHRALGAEALIRWIHPARGMISPAQFIPLAEETGLILPIGLWVLETACAQLKVWQQNAHTRDLTLAVNVSARQFRQTDFVAQVQDAVQRHAINPKLLKLELTESLLQESIEETVAIMVLLHVIGVQFSLDDFGTGYSSLQYLKRLPLDQLKIDQSFVRDIATDSSDKAVIRAIIAMARSLELDVIAEGVETEEQQQLLLKNGCTHYQGYLFGRPMPIEEFDVIIKRG